MRDQEWQIASVNMPIDDDADESVRSEEIHLNEVERIIRTTPSAQEATGRECVQLQNRAQILHRPSF